MLFNLTYYLSRNTMIDKTWESKVVNEFRHVTVTFILNGPIAGAGYYVHK